MVSALKIINKLLKNMEAQPIQFLSAADRCLFYIVMMKSTTTYAFNNMTICKKKRLNKQK